MSGTACDCTFAYWSVVPPTHCPKCGRCLTCGHGLAPLPVSPWPSWPYPYVQPSSPFWPFPNSTITYTTNSSASPAMGMVS